MVYSCFDHKENMNVAIKVHSFEAKSNKIAKVE